VKVRYPLLLAQYNASKHGWIGPEIKSLSVIAKEQPRLILSAFEIVIIQITVLDCDTGGVCRNPIFPYFIFTHVL
jgi:hypothetical protein